MSNLYSDGCLKIWNVQNTECLFSLNLFDGALIKSQVNLPTIHHIVSLNFDTILVGNQSNYIYAINLRKGVVIKTFKIDNPNENFNTLSFSSNGNYVYATTDSKKYLSFDYNSGKNVQNVTASSSNDLKFGDIVGISHHPFSNILVMWTDDGKLNLWK